MKEELFLKGDYVVLLASCDGGDCWQPTIPINHCYRLTKNYKPNSFMIDRDMRGLESNGWSASNYPSKLKVRRATSDEIETYNRLGKPFKVSDVVYESYEIY